jgi:hypothetical protein
VNVVRTRCGVNATNSSVTTGSANSQPRLCPMSASPPSSTAEPANAARSSGSVSRRDASTTHGQNAADHSAVFPFAYPTGVASRPSMKCAPGSSDAAALSSSSRPTTATARANAPTSAAAGRPRIRHSANSAKSTV